MSFVGVGVGVKRVMAIYFRGTRQELRAVSFALANMLAGREADTFGVRRGFLLSLGFGALSDIKQAYIEKARGGTDEMGIKWEPLKPATIANRRVGPRDKDNDADIKERERVRRNAERRLFKRFRLSMPESEARARARRAAAQVATRETGKTKVETLGGREVEILRDTGVLFNSLSPGLLSGAGASATYQRPSQDGGDQQVFDVHQNGVIVGTNVQYAATHQQGDSARNIPARPFLPPTESSIPETWWQRWIDIGVASLRVAAEEVYTQGGN